MNKGDLHEADGEKRETRPREMFHLVDLFENLLNIHTEICNKAWNQQSFKEYK